MSYQNLKHWVTEITSTPAVEPVSLTEQKEHMRVDISAEDTLITTLIKAARQNIETLTGIRFITQSVNVYFDRFPCDNTIYLPIGPISAVADLKYIDSSDVENTVDNSVYSVDNLSLPARIRLKADNAGSWPYNSLRSVNGVKIECTAGYGASGADVPQDLVHAVKFLTAHFFENREIVAFRSFKELPFGIKCLLANYKMWQRATT